MTIVPAYGRDYKSTKEVKAAWESNLDFEIADVFHGGGKYINKQDAEGLTSIFARYSRLRKQVKVQ